MFDILRIQVNFTNFTRPMKKIIRIICCLLTIIKNVIQIRVLKYIKEKTMIQYNRQKNQLGQGMTEYIIIVALVAVAAIGVYSAFGNAIKSQMAVMTGEIAGKPDTAAAAKVQTDATKGAAAGATDKTLQNFSKDNQPK